MMEVHVLPAPKRTFPRHAHEPPSSEHFMKGIGSHRHDCVRVRVEHVCVSERKTLRQEWVQGDRDKDKRQKAMVLYGYVI